jgi:hypothetical protein
VFNQRKIDLTYRPKTFEKILVKFGLCCQLQCPKQRQSYNVQKVKKNKVAAATGLRIKCISRPANARLQMVQTINSSHWPIVQRRIVHSRKSGNGKDQAHQIGYTSETGLGSSITSNPKVLSKSPNNICNSGMQTKHAIKRK